MIDLNLIIHPVTELEKIKKLRTGLMAHVVFDKKTTTWDYSTSIPKAETHNKSE